MEILSRTPNPKLPCIIVPAYNEENVITRLLLELEKGLENNDYEVIVACNGCTDNTVKLVREHHPNFICLDIDLGSKTNALNQAEQLKPGFPRVYLDADIQIQHESINTLINEALKHSKPIIVAPRGLVNTKQSPYAVEQFYKAWQKTRFYLHQGYGSGVYILNEPARKLFDTFPNIIADDGFIREFVDEKNIIVCEAATSTVEAPRTYRDLLKIKVRSKLGNNQLKALKVCKIVHTTEDTKRFLIKPTTSERIIYILTNLFAKISSQLKGKSLSKYVWHRDESSRL